MSDLAEYLAGVVGVIEATSFEHHSLWCDYAEAGQKHGRRFPWNETGHGTLQQVGGIGNRPIWISILTATVDGHKLLFWHVTSPVADHDQCEAWLRVNLPETAFREDGRLNQSDPMNFTNVFPRVRQHLLQDTRP